MQAFTGNEGGTFSSQCVNCRNARCACTHNMRTCIIKKNITITIHVMLIVILGYIMNLYLFYFFFIAHHLPTMLNFHAGYLGPILVIGDAVIRL